MDAQLHVEMDDRCRALARVLALVEGRGMTIGEVRFSPATRNRSMAFAMIEVHGRGRAETARLRVLLQHIEALPLVRRARIEEPLAA